MTCDKNELKPCCKHKNYEWIELLGPNKHLQNGK